MKRIKAYKKVFGVEGPLVLKDLKTTYRGLVKEWHPDKFQDEEKKAEAEVQSKVIIDAYHFLVSIAPETKEANAAEYAETLETCTIADYDHKGLRMDVTFSDGTSYEYFGVNEKLFQKFINADKQFRFARRNIFNSFTYRKSKKSTEVA